MSSWWTRLPLHWIIRRAARSQGFLDPLEILARLRGLAQPSEVSEPVELLRAGVVFHARGLINSKVIQNNLDWIWPYWVERQYNPRDPSFVPRAFSVTHVNLSQRNWTAVGVPGEDALPVVDPRGLLTPHLDGWSVDCWVLGEDGEALFPSRCAQASQHFESAPEAAVHTRCEQRGLWLESRVEAVRAEDGSPVCKLAVRCGDSAGGRGRLVLSLRPCNPEGVARIHHIALANGRDWRIDHQHGLHLSSAPERHIAANYREGDVLFQLGCDSERESVDCEAGLASAAAVFPFNGEGGVEITIPLKPLQPGAPQQGAAHSAAPLAEIAGQAAQLECPDPAYRSLYATAVASLILHAPGDVYPGPYTYRRFWFRDAALILHAMLCIGLEQQSEQAISRFFKRQTRGGYFRSQEGEWDSNGEVLWLLERYSELCNRPLPAAWLASVERGARWIARKRLPETPPSAHAGLMPAGFSAEHLGPNDYYYWDDFWSVAGLESAARLLAGRHGAAAQAAADEAQRLRGAIESSLAQCAERLGRPGMPAAPYRRMDAGAVGSLAASYPLQLMPAQDPRLLDCAGYLLEHCCIDDAFFQDMVHSGFNAYLTLHIAQVLLRAGDDRYLALVDRVAALASPTGQWPEAIHPGTGGGCMGDGQHIWAAAEWILMLRQFFVREEGEALVLCQGIPQRWLDSREAMSFGPTATRFGPVTVQLEPRGDNGWTLHCEGSWWREAPNLECGLAGWQVTERRAGTLVLTQAPSRAENTQEATA